LFFIYLFLSLYLCLTVHCRCRGYCYPCSESLSRVCARAHTHTHTHTWGRTSMDKGMGLCRGLSTWKCTALRTENHSCPQRDSNLQSQQAAATDPCLRPCGHQHQLYILHV